MIIVVDKTMPENIGDVLYKGQPLLYFDGEVHRRDMDADI